MPAEQCRLASLYMPLRQPLDRYIIGIFKAGSFLVEIEIVSVENYVKVVRIVSKWL